MRIREFLNGIFATGDREFFTNFADDSCSLTTNHCGFLPATGNTPFDSGADPDDDQDP